VTWTGALAGETPKAAHDAPRARPVASASDGYERRYALAALERECRDIESTPEGSRNVRLNLAALKAGQLCAHLSEAEAFEALAAAAKRAGLEKSEIKATFKSGWTKGTTEPREIPPSKYAQNAAPEDPAPADDYEPSAEDAPDAPPPASSEQPTSILFQRWLDLADHPEFLTETPPEQRWLLKQWHDGRDHGVFPRGRTGLLTATGGVGKTYALIQSAIAVAAGGFWFDGFRAVEPGHVLLALGEEDADEARRRIWRAVNASDLTPDQRVSVVEHMHILPLHGIPIALTHAPPMGEITESAFAGEFRAHLEGFGVDWSLIILDPLSRWASGGVETANEAATRFVQVLETFTKVRGLPSVLVAHHSSQASARMGASDARGVTGIRDGFRWQASLDLIADEDSAVEGVLMRNTKSNYSLRFRPLLLSRNTEPGIEGTLRPATGYEEGLLRALLPKDRQTAEQRAENKQARVRESFSADCELVASLLPTAPAFWTRDQLWSALEARGQSWGHARLTKAVTALMTDHRAVDLSDGAKSKPRQWALTGEAQ
jgi:hypothetical protein